MMKLMELLSKWAYTLSPIFYNLVFMSLIATVIGVVLLLIRRLLDKKLTAFSKLALWGLVFLALLFPIRFASEKAILPKIEVPTDSDFRRSYHKAEHTLFLYEQEERKSRKEWKEKEEIDFEKKNSIADLKKERIKEKRKEVDVLFVKALFLDVIFPLIWFLGSTFLLLGLVIGKLSLERKLRREGRKTEEFNDCILRVKQCLKMKNEVEVIQVSSLPSPALVGFFKPRIVLPHYAEKLSAESLYFVIMHELAHFKKGDMWLNFFLLFLQSLYWFHPLSWMMFKLIREDMEVLTDEYVLERIKEEEKRVYALSLVEVLSHTHKIPLLPRLLCMVDGKKNVEKRIRLMGLREKIKKYRWFVSFGLVLISVFLIAIFFTEKKVDDGSDVISVLKNLKVEEVVDLELTHYDEKKERELYADLKGEDKKNALSLLKSFEGKKNKDFKGVIQLKTSFYLRTVRGEVFSFAVNASEPETTIALNMKYSFKADQNFLHEIEKFSELAKNEVPKNFPRDSERFRGMEFFLVKDEKEEGGSIGFSFREGLYRHGESFHDKKKELDESLRIAFHEFYEKNLRDIFLLRRKLRNKGFTKADVYEFSARKYEEGEALFRIQENLTDFLEKKVGRKRVELVFAIYDERVGIVIEDEEAYLLYESFYDGRIDEEKEGRLRVELQKEYEDVPSSLDSEASQSHKGQGEEKEKRTSEEFEVIGNFYEKAFSSLKKDEDRLLSESELEKIARAFSPLLPGEKGGKDDLITNSLCNFFYAAYGDVDNVDLKSFLWYFGKVEELKRGNPSDEEEFKELKRMGVTEVKNYELGGTITPVQRIKASDVEYILKTYADIGLKDLTNTEGAIYSEKYNHYYVFTSDFGLGQFSPSFGEIKDGELILEDDGRRLVMKHADGRWVFQSFTNKVLRHYKTYLPEGFQGKVASFSPHVMLDVDTYRYEFVYNPALSYLPKGNFEVISGEILKLYDRNLGYFEFKILDEDTLEFISSSIETEKMTFQGVEIKPGIKFLAVKE